MAMVQIFWEDYVCLNVQQEMKESMEVANHVQKIFLKNRLTKRACHVHLREPALNARALMKINVIVLLVW
jgi:hypothetical protein